MIADEDWLPASGCFSCPFEISLPQSWGIMNPLPGFANPGGGYFSVPLKTWYLPIQSCRPFGQFAVGEIDEADFDLFLAIAVHELHGHSIGDGPFFGVPRKQLLRLCAAQAYIHLQEVLENGQLKELSLTQLGKKAVKNHVWDKGGFGSFKALKLKKIRLRLFAHTSGYKQIEISL